MPNRRRVPKNGDELVRGNIASIEFSLDGETESRVPSDRIKLIHMRQAYAEEPCGRHCTLQCNAIFLFQSCISSGSSYDQICLELLGSNILAIVKPFTAVCPRCPPRHSNSFFGSMLLPGAVALKLGLNPQCAVSKTRICLLLAPFPDRTSESVLPLRPWRPGVVMLCSYRFNW